MKSSAMVIKHLFFSGPDKEPVGIEFGYGLNVVYGASETGKSFILEALDYMMGSGNELRDIPERVGYDRIFFGFLIKNEQYTLERSTNGGEFRCYEGLHKSLPKILEPDILKAKHQAGRSDTVSSFLLSKLNLQNKNIRRNAKGKTISFTFRNLAHLALVSELEIQKKLSPFLTGQHISKTSEIAAYKLLLTGVDDSAMQSEIVDEKTLLSKTAKLEVINELIANYESQLEEVVNEEDVEDLDNQLKRIQASIDRESSLLQTSETKYRDTLKIRNESRKKAERIYNRCSEIDGMLARFKLLHKHYNSDLSRLNAIRESGSLIVELNITNCPLCGASPESQHNEKSCDGNINAVVLSAIAEADKITILKEELEFTILKLKEERNRYNNIIPEISSSVDSYNNELEVLNPDISKKRSMYSELVSKRSTTLSAINLKKNIEDLEAKRESINDSNVKHENTEPTMFDLSDSILNKFSIVIEEILKKWQFPEAQRVFFDKISNDVVIAGKPRGSRGKGMRAITHAAFSIAMMKYTEENNLPHTGFVILDSPLVAYREPEGEEDSLRGTEVQRKFYEDLSAWTTRQVIILENENPPEFIQNAEQTTFFSKNANIGRYGFLSHLDLA